jgi:hypothetical protein
MRTNASRSAPFVPRTKEPGKRKLTSRPIMAVHVIANGRTNGGIRKTTRPLKNYVSGLRRPIFQNAQRARRLVALANIAALRPWTAP